MGKMVYTISALRFSWQDSIHKIGPSCHVPVLKSFKNMQGFFPKMCSGEAADQGVVADGIQFESPFFQSLGPTSLVHGLDTPISLRGPSQDIPGWKKSRYFDDVSPIMSSFPDVLSFWGYYNYIYIYNNIYIYIYYYNLLYTLRMYKMCVHLTLNQVGEFV